MIYVIEMLNILKQRDVELLLLLSSLLLLSLLLLFFMCWKITTPQEIPNWGHAGCWSKLKYESIANSLGGRPWSNGAGWLRRHPICHVSWCSNPLESWFSLMLGDLLIFNSYIMDFSGYFFRGVQGVDSRRVVWVLITYSAIRVMFSDNHDHPSFQRMRTMWWKYKEPSRYSSWQLANSSFWFCTAGPGRGPPPWFMFCMIGVPNSVYSLQPLQPALATTRREILGVARDAERSGSTTFGNEDVHRIDRDEPWTWIYGFGNVLMQTRSVISPFFTLKKETQNGKKIKWIGTTDPTLGEHPSHDHWPSLVFDRGWIRRPPLRSFLFTRAGLRCSCGETQRCAVRVRGLFFFVPLINT